MSNISKGTENSSKLTTTWKATERDYFQFSENSGLMYLTQLIFIPSLQYGGNRIYAIETLLFTHSYGISVTTIGWEDNGHNFSIWREFTHELYGTKTQQPLVMPVMQCFRI
jgi:hypothetical protein